MPHGSPIRSDQPWRDVQLAGEGDKVDGGAGEDGESKPHFTSARASPLSE